LVLDRALKRLIFNAKAQWQWLRLVAKLSWFLPMTFQMGNRHAATW
jgi:hypothetical protein